MPVPAGALFWGHIGLDKVRNHLAIGGIGHAQILVEKKVAQTIAAPGGIGRLDMGEAGAGGVQHGGWLLRG